MKLKSVTRETLLETAFCDIPVSIGDRSLRPLTAGSFTLLGRLKNPMMVGSPEGEELDQTAMFEAVIQYVWVHATDISQVIAVQTADDIPAADIRSLGFQITLGQALAFLSSYRLCAARMAASLAEVDEDDGDAPGKSAAPGPSPVGSPLSLLPSGPPETPPGSATSSGPCPSSEPSLTSMPPMSPMEPAANGLVLPQLTAPDPAPTPP